MAGSFRPYMMAIICFTEGWWKPGVSTGYRHKILQDSQAV